MFTSGTTGITLPSIFTPAHNYRFASSAVTAKNDLFAGKLRRATGQDERLYHRAAGSWPDAPAQFEVACGWFAASRLTGLSQNLDPRDVGISAGAMSAAGAKISKTHRIDSTEIDLVEQSLLREYFGHVELEPAHLERIELAFVITNQTKPQSAIA
jgi:hypothetical protein